MGYVTGQSYRTWPRARYTDGIRVSTATPGAYRGAGTEGFVLMRPNRRSEQARRPVVVYCHGLLGFAADATKGLLAKQLRWLVAAGYPVIAADLGGPTPWGNDDSKTAFGQALTYAASTFGVDTSRVAIVMESMGGTLGFPWMAENIGRVVWAYGLVPVVSMPLVAARPNNAALAATMYSAYGSQAAWTAALPTHDPSAAGVMRSLAGSADRIRIDGDMYDPIILPSDYEPFMAGVPGMDMRLWPGAHTIESRAGAGRELAVWADRMTALHA